MAFYDLKSRCKSDEVFVTEAEWTEETQRIESLIVRQHEIDEENSDWVKILTPKRF